MKVMYCKKNFLLSSLFISCIVPGNYKTFWWNSKYSKYSKRWMRCILCNFKYSKYSNRWMWCILCKTLLDPLQFSLSSLIHKIFFSFLFPAIMIFTIFKVREVKHENTDSIRKFQSESKSWRWFLATWIYRLRPSDAVSHC